MFPVTGSPAIAARGLTKRYGGSYAVKDASFELGAGEVVGFVGPNGAGKTTTLRMIVGLVRPSGGSVELLGAGVPGPTLGRAGAMIEEPSFYEYMTGLGNLRHAARLHGGVAPTRPEEVLEFVKLEKAADKKVKAYSQGMRQRLALARALLWRPDVLLLDEPTNGLDPTGIAEFRETLRVVAAGGATVLISSHILSEVEKVVDRVLAITAGEIRFDGSLTALLSQVGGAQVRYSLRATDGPNLMAALREMSYAPAAAGPDGATVELPAADADELLYRLATAGVHVVTATKSASDLEGAYLKLLGVENRPS